jgi:hypothetical protein
MQIAGRFVGTAGNQGAGARNRALYSLLAAPQELVTAKVGTVAGFMVDPNIVDD